MRIEEYIEMTNEEFEAIKKGFQICINGEICECAIGYGGFDENGKPIPVSLMVKDKFYKIKIVKVGIPSLD